MTRRFVLALAITLLGFAPGLQAAKPPVLVLLEHVADDGKSVQTKIELKSGVVESKDKGKPRAKWTIRAGDLFPPAARPDDRVVNFYTAAGREYTLLFMVKVRYFQRSDGKWAPQFQLNEEPLVIRGPDGRWKPLTAIQGVPNLIVQSGSTLPNAEGYLTSIELGFTVGATSIDAWAVQ
jgi:hypothetical protein